jgi:hypothetical protein
MRNSNDIETKASVAHSEFVSIRPAPMEAPQVTWWKHRGLRKLYPMMPILFLGSTINGYDGSLLNGLQTMAPWQDCECQRPFQIYMLILEKTLTIQVALR